MLYESAARADEVLCLNVEDLYPQDKHGRITAKGGATEWIHWQSGTAQLLPRLIARRTRCSSPTASPGRNPDTRRVSGYWLICRVKYGLKCRGAYGVLAGSRASALDPAVWSEAADSGGRCVAAVDREEFVAEPVAVAVIETTSQ
ncbi:hypothetical protein STRCI_008292 [Streptomyces cinnabarinus]|uniref:Uncharacterized protein n=1 Tax=Streptomyces cinnabarinus TaxID=67287 RepID=A0ABY7KSS9_9ACTN|nr:hypothetical protein [Streptomyces cinnabarinus]WAZ26680.1 hypothetical protein STRCI_008292 [Streptomyces cinnabarinus]